MASNRWPCLSVTAVRCSGPSSWYRIRCDAWERMQAHADQPGRRCLPRRRWSWHDTRHTFALQLLSYLEQQMDGDEPDAVARRRRHLAYLGGHIKHNPLLIVSRRLGHSSPATHTPIWNTPTTR